MREIKFRVFETENHNMYYPDGNQFGGGKNIIWKFEDNTIIVEVWEFDNWADPDENEMHTHKPEQFCMQFTGLKDKYGVDIYEGDIIDEGKIYFDINLLGFFVESLIDEDEPVKPLYDIPFVEVLGNIHENAELLK